MGLDIPGTEKYVWHVDVQYMWLNEFWMNCIIVTYEVVYLFLMYYKYLKVVIQILFIFVPLTVSLHGNSINTCWFILIL